MEKIFKNKKILIIVVFIIISLLIYGIYALLRIYNEKKDSIIDNEYRETLNTTLSSKYQEFIELKLAGKYNQNIDIYLKEDFEKLEYKEKKEEIININNSVNEIFNSYVEKKNINEEKIENKLCIYVNEKCYLYDTKKDKITKNNEELTEISDLIEKIENLINDKEYEKYIKAINNVNTLKDILKLNKDEMKKELIYLYAEKKYNEYNYKEAIEQFNLVKDYKKQKDYIYKAKLYLELQGTWYGSVNVNSPLVNNYKYDVSHKWIIKGNDCYNIYSDSKSTNAYKKYFLIIGKNNKLYISEDEEKKSVLYDVEYDKKTLKYKMYEDSSTMKLKKISQDNNLPTTVYIKEPAIGMTKEEVRNSTWGSPNKINTTTTRYGVHEQWVYPNFKYLYFENDKLVSIQTNE